MQWHLTHKGQLRVYPFVHTVFESWHIQMLFCSNSQLEYFKQSYFRHIIFILGHCLNLLCLILYILLTQMYKSHFIGMLPDWVSCEPWISFFYKQRKRIMKRNIMSARKVVSGLHDHINIIPLCHTSSKELIEKKTKYLLLNYKANWPWHCF